MLVIQSSKPTNHIRIVIAGISGSSILDTEARTSGYGLSSSSMASKSKSNLEKVRVFSNLVERKAELKTLKERIKKIKTSNNKIFQMTRNEV